jgi:hypothetical protein
MYKKIIIILTIIVLLFSTMISPVFASGTQVATTGLYKFGNMVYGNGLNGLFDGQATNSYYQSYDGYAGVVFSSPQKITEIQIDSQVNGFDASGLSTSITLSIYARISGTPTSSTDGTLIGSLSTFTDIESANTKTISSTDTTTQFSCVWVRVQTGVWAAATEIRIYGDDNSPTSTLTNTTTITLTPTVTSTITPTATPCITEITNNITFLEKHIDTITNMTYTGDELQGFRIRFKLNNVSAAKILFSTDVIHRGNLTGYNGAISIGFVIAYKYSESLSGLDTASFITKEQDESLKNATRGVNIDEINPAHYAEVTIPQNFDLQPGYYEFTIFGRAATDAYGYTTTNGLAAILAEGDHGLNGFFIDIYPGADVIEIQ